MARVQKRVTTSGAAAYIVKWRDPTGRTAQKAGSRQGRRQRTMPRSMSSRGVGAGWSSTLRRAWCCFGMLPRCGWRRATTSRTRPAPPTQTLWPRRPITRSGGTSAGQLAHRQHVRRLPGERHSSRGHLGVDRADEGGGQEAVHDPQRLLPAAADPRASGRRWPVGKQPRRLRKAADGPQHRPYSGCDDPAMFDSAAQVAAIVAATPWPFSMLVHLAAWSGLRASELAGLRVGDVTVPRAGLNPNAPVKPGHSASSRPSRGPGRPRPRWLPRPGAAAARCP